MQPANRSMWTMTVEEYERQFEDDVLSGRVEVERLDEPEQPQGGGVLSAVVGVLSFMAGGLVAVWLAGKADL